MEVLLRRSKLNNETVIRLFKDRSSPRSYKEFTCVVSHQGREYRSVIPASELQDLLEEIESATVTVRGQCAMGVDGVSYELSIENDFAYSCYRWWMVPDDGWNPLVQIAGRLLHIGFQYPVST